jgi:hypothetical protein
MFRIPSRLVLVIGVALGLSLAVALWASATSTPAGFARTDVKIEAKDIEAKDIEAKDSEAKDSRVKASPAASREPLKRG